MRKARLYILIALSLLISGYTYVWYHTAHQLENLILSHVTHLETKGYRVAYDALKIKGFPLEFWVFLASSWFFEKTRRNYHS